MTVTLKARRVCSGKSAIPNPGAVCDRQCEGIQIQSDPYHLKPSAPTYLTYPLSHNHQHHPSHQTTISNMSVKRDATISDDWEVSVYFDPLIVVGDAEDEDVAAESLSAIFSGSSAQLNDRIDGDAGAVNVLSVRVINVLPSAFCLAQEEREVHGFRELGGVVDIRVVFHFGTLFSSKSCG